MIFWKKRKNEEQKQVIDIEALKKEIREEVRREEQENMHKKDTFHPKSNW